MGVFSKKAKLDRDRIRLVIPKNGSADVVVLGDETAYREHWIDKRQYSCEGPSCVHCATGIKAGRKYAVPVALIAKSGVLLFKAMELPLTLLEELQALDAQENLEAKVVRVTRQEGQVGSPALGFTLERALTDEEIVKVAGIAGCDLREIYGCAKSAEEAGDAGF